MATAQAPSELCRGLGPLGRRCHALLCAGPLHGLGSVLAFGCCTCWAVAAMMKQALMVQGHLDSAPLHWTSGCHPLVGSWALQGAGQVLDSVHLCRDPVSDVAVSSGAGEGPAPPEPGLLSSGGSREPSDLASSGVGGSCACRAVCGHPMEAGSRGAVGSRVAVRSSGAPRGELHPNSRLVEGDTWEECDRVGPVCTPQPWQSGAEGLSGLLELALHGGQV